MADAKIRLSVEGATMVKSELDRVNAGLSGMASEANMLKATLLGLVGGLSAGAFIGMIKGSIDAADRLNDLRKSTGLTIETLSGLKLASKQSGADLEGTAAAINKLSVNIGKNGDKFSALGITAKDPLEAFKQLSDVFIAIDDPQLRAAVGAEALGKSWASAAPLLMEGGSQIQTMVDKGTALSRVNTDMAEQADAFNDKLAELTGTGGLMNSMTASLLPLLNLVADELLDMHKKSEGANDGFSILAETFRAVVVLGGNVAFTFKGVGREIGGVAAQLAAFGSGDLKGALAIGDMMKSDAAQARKDFDAWEAKAMNAGKKLNELKGYSAAKDSAASQAQDAKRAAAVEAAAKARAFIDGAAGGGKDKAEKVSEYQRLQQAITKVTAAQELELLNGGKLTASQKFQFDEMQKINFALQTKKISGMEQLELIRLTTIAMAKMVEVEKQAALIKANVAGYADEIQFRKELTDAEEDVRKAKQLSTEALFEYSQAVKADNELTAFELSLVGQTEEAKKREIALYRVEIELLKQKEAIKKNMPYDAAGQNEAFAKAEATAALAKAGVTSRIQLDAAEKAKQEQIDLWKQIDSTAESVFMDIAKNGTSAFKHLEDELKNGLLKLLYEMTVKKWIISIGSDLTGLDLGKLMGGKGDSMASGLLNKGVSYLSGGGYSDTVNSLATGMGYGQTAGAGFGTTTYANMVGAGGGDSMGAFIASNGSWGGVASGAGEVASILPELEAGFEAFTVASELATVGTVATGASITGMATAALAAVPVIGWVALGAAALFAVFSSGKDKIPTVLNDLALFNNSLVGLPFLELALGTDEVAQGLRDVLYGLENASPTMRKLAGETLSLSVELMRSAGDIAGAANLARNIGTRGMSEKEIGLFDANNAMRDQIAANNAASAAASAGAAAAREAEAAENALAQTRYNIAGKLNILLGRTTQLEFDRATALAATTDEASLAMLRLTYTMEDLYTAADKAYAKLERSIAAEKKALDDKYAADIKALNTAIAAENKALDEQFKAQDKALNLTYAAEKKVAELRLRGSQDLANALKSTKDAISPLMGRAFAQSQISMYLALAKAGGVLPTADALKPSLEAIAKPSEDLFSTFEEYAIDQARTANDISDLSGLADKQLTTEEKAYALMESTYDLAKEQLNATQIAARDQLDATHNAAKELLDATLGTAKAELDAKMDIAKQQMDAFKGIDTSITNVANAILEFEASMVAIATAAAKAPITAYTASTATTTSGGGGSSYSGGGSYSGGSTTASATAGMDGDIVAAYNAYYGRNPDQGGYDSFIKSGLTGDAMMQAILRASIADRTGADYNYALSKGFDPENPLGNYYHGKGAYKATAPVIENYAVGSNYIDRDQIAQIHQGEEITPRAYVDMQRASRDETNALMARLVRSNEELKDEVMQLRKSSDRGNENTRRAADTLQGQQGVPFLVTIAT